jgi:hypothetical protein
MSAPPRRSERHAAKKAAAAVVLVAEPQPTLQEWEELLFAHETFNDLLEDARMPSTRKHAILNCAEIFEYAATQSAYLAYQPGFRAAICAKADELTVAIEDGEPTRAVLRLAAALTAFQNSVGAIYAHRLLRRL